MTQVATNIVPTLSYGSLSVGLVRADFEKNGGDISLFDKVDKLDGNADGKLSETDLLEYREDESSSLMGFGCFATVGSVVAAIAGGPIGWGLCAFNALTALLSFTMGYSIDGHTEEYLNAKEK